MRNIFIPFYLLVFFSCKQESLPKPKAYLNLQYSNNEYKILPIDRPYLFDISKNTIIKDEKYNWIKIQYPTLKASIDITYRKVNDNIAELIKEAEKLVFKHTLKAEEIKPKDFLNREKRVFATMYEITGNAASQIQFHATDSVNNFIKGSLYFYVKPNYDSILPAVTYIKKDVLRIIETLEWTKK
mgnify:CR=1 FL=1|tara:strand:+ start:534 stop:1088 length:555 start_codon:yes stop_codon:yes gene_type:complete